MRACVLGRWAQAFGNKLAREDPGGFYGALGGLCTAFVVSECRRVGVSAGPDFLRRSPDLAAAPMGCEPQGALRFTFASSAITPDTP